MAFVADDKSAPVKEPTDRPFDLVASFVASQGPTILSRSPCAVLAVFADEFDLPCLQTLAERIAVGRSIVEQPHGLASRRAPLDQSLDELDLRLAGAGAVGPQRYALPIDEQPDLRAVAFLGLADLDAPFFAGENVPSPIVSSQLIRCSRSSLPSSRAHAVLKTPDVAHSCSRRQQVLGEGKCLGKSFQRAPLCKIHKMPSKHGRDATRGRPPTLVIGVWGNRSAIQSPCSSVSSGWGSVLDPVRFRPRRGQDTRVSFMRVTPFTPSQ